MRQRLGVVAVLVCVVFATAALAARIGDRRERVPLPSQRYERSVTLSLDYGNAKNQLGIRTGDFETRPEGPESFAVAADGTIAIADSLHERVVVFDQNGHVVRSNDGIVASDIHITDNSMFILDPATSRMLEITSRGERVSDIAVDPSADRVTSLLIQKAEQSRRFAVQSEQAMKAAEPMPMVTVVNDRIGEVKVGDSRFTVATGGSLGSLDFIGTDAAGNLFVAVEELLPTNDSSISVKTEVRKYGPKGELLAQIPMDMNTVTQPRRPFVVTPDGTLYHMKPTREMLLVERFDIH